MGGILEKAYDGITFDWRHYIRAEGQVVAIVSRKSTGTNAVHYALEDNQGSGSTLVDAAGTGYVRQSYNAFGLPRDGTDWDGAVPSVDQGTINGITRRGYTGHSMMGAMGLIHMNGRVQGAVIGRFLSPDPYVQSPGFTQSYNRYAYVNNNPLSFIDPSGFFCMDNEGNVGNPDHCPEFEEVVVLGARLSRAAYDAFMYRLSTECLSSHSYVQDCDAAYQWVALQDAMHMSQLEALAREEERAAGTSRSRHTGTTGRAASPQSEYGYLANAQCHMHWGMNCASVNAMTDEQALSARFAQEFSVPMMGIGSIFAGLRGAAGNLARLPDDASQLGHIFANRAGHLVDSPANRQLLVDLANNAAARVGTDRFGNVVSALPRADGSQIWVYTQNGVIQNGGLNSVPRTFNVVGP